MVACTDNAVDDIVFLDIEAATNEEIKELGLVLGDRELKTTSISAIKNFLETNHTSFICGHNFIDFDYKLLETTSLYRTLQRYHIIDTLPLSLLLFNEKTHHSLPKNYKSEDDFKNDPVEDSKITRSLLEKVVEKFLALERDIQNIFYALLKDEDRFCGFFAYLETFHKFEILNHERLAQKILSIHKEVLANTANLSGTIQKNPVELAYILALLSPHIEIKSHPPKILYDYPTIVGIQKALCFDFKQIDEKLSDFSKEVFGFGTFREFPKLNPALFGKKSISQREIVEASLRDESFLTVLPTGGGKTFTFWLPAIIKAKAYKSLTVVISPLQALIEDHIKSFNKNIANYKAVAISGFMSPLERAEAIEQTINGEADILYLAPESLRSNMIFNILKNRLIERFVIDEVHCLSTWGNDFRQDYYYICEYIKDLIEAKPFQSHIPVSCFTATAKPNVINDIKRYFFDGLGLKLDEYIAIPERKNLQYKSISAERKDKYLELLKLVNEHDGSTLIYIPSSTKKCDEIAEKLSLDTDKKVKSFHSKLDSMEKMTILKEYITDEINVIVATTAFGMGVDKPNITNVIHYEMSDSLENYAQEAGRGARDTSLQAFCPILYDENDLDKHFASLNRSKITISDINSIFRVLKRAKSDIVIKSAFELAEEAGWDVEDDASDYTTKVKTVLLELEREGYIKRKRNKVRFYADSIAVDSIEKLHNKLEHSTYSREEKERLTLVHQTILGRGKTLAVQVDELAYMLGYERSLMAESIEQLKEMDILGDSKDLSLEFKKTSLKNFAKIVEIELDLFGYLSSLWEKENKVTIKELNESLGGEKNHTELIKDIVKNWRDKSAFIFKRVSRQKDLWYFDFVNREKLQESMLKKHKVSKEVLDVFSKQLKSTAKVATIEFSLKNLRQQLKENVSIKELDKTLLYLHHLGIVELLSGRFISYSPMQIQKTEKFTNKRKYTKLEYKQRLEKHYQTKIESIHIMGEYSKRLQSDSSSAIRFMRDYFTAPYADFKKKYNLLKKKITRPITERRYNKIFSKMSSAQQQVISDKESKAMMVLAGPGSGKTKVLVHKIASLILTEDIKPEQFMMLTFSRSAVSEFKHRLNELIGTLSYDIEINTFHAYALKLIARVVTKENEDILNQSILEATKQIKSGEVTLPLKTVLILDEFQDINENSFELVKAIYEASERELKIIAVGDDDQCINTHAGADITFIDKFRDTFGKDEEGKNLFKQYELLTNFRSKSNIVAYANHFITKVEHRYKTKPLESYTQEKGKVSVYTCKSTNLIAPAVKLIENEVIHDDIAILAYTNDEVMQIYSRLYELGINARYILDREKFELKNIVEIVEFDKVVNSYLNANNIYQEDDFHKAFEVIGKRYKGSKNLQLLKRVIDRFLHENESYYASQWLAYLDELKLEAFQESGNYVTVSTIHKSKGMEFNKVVLLVKDNPKTDQEKRLYYVGMTRAKEALTIIRHGTKNLKGRACATYILDETMYDTHHKTQTYVMGLSDIYLGYDYESNYPDLQIVAGMEVEIGRDKSGHLSLYCKNKQIGRFSKAFEKKINFSGGAYQSHIEYIVLWFDADKNKYVKHPLCTITLM